MYTSGSVLVAPPAAAVDAAAVCTHVQRHTERHTDTHKDIQRHAVAHRDIERPTEICTYEYGELRNKTKPLPRYTRYMFTRYTHITPHIITHHHVDVTCMQSIHKYAKHLHILDLPTFIASMQFRTSRRRLSGSDAECSSACRLELIRVKRK